MISVLSFNIHKGTCSLGLRQTLAGIKAMLNRLNPDIVLLQEVRGAHSSIDQSQFEQLADTLWPSFAYGKNASYDAGHHGNCILSRFPILSTRNVDISTNSLESRGLLLADVDVPHWPTTLELACTHLDLFHKGRARQREAIIAELSKIPSERSLILAGDFNDWTIDFTDPLFLRLGLKEAFYQLNGAHVRSFPSYAPVLKLDRLYYRNLTALKAECPTAKGEAKLSDHLPIMVQLDLPEA